jgi:hypothetical protein
MFGGHEEVEDGISRVKRELGGLDDRVGMGVAHGRRLL